MIKSLITWLYARFVGNIYLPKDCKYSVRFDGPDKSFRWRLPDGLRLWSSHNGYDEKEL